MGKSQKTSVSIALKYIDDKGRTVTCEDIRLAKECKALPRLSDSSYRLLKKDIQQRIKKESPQILTQPITITENGLVIDGRHRARALVELGLRERLINEIGIATQDPAGTKLGSFPLAVVAQPTRASLAMQVVRMQHGRRSLNAWRLAILLLADYQKIAASASNRTSNGHQVLDDDGRPFESVKAFCDSIGISERIFQIIAKIKKSPSVYERLISGEIGLTGAYEEARGPIQDGEKSVLKKSGAAKRNGPSTRRLKLENEGDVDALFERVKRNGPEHLKIFAQKLSEALGLTLTEAT